MIRIDSFIAGLLLIFIVLSPAVAIGTEGENREQQIAKKLAVAADADEIIKLKATGGKFIGVYKRGRLKEYNPRQSNPRQNKPRQSKPEQNSPEQNNPEQKNQGNINQAKGVVILVHGLGAHPDWPDVISPLRIHLAESGWSTFSIQMPILSPAEPVAEYGKTMKMAVSRIQAAVEYLHAWKLQPIILLGYSFGAVQAASYLANNKSANKDEIAAFVSVSMLTQKFIKPGLDVNKMISKINIPILDIYGEKDLEEVRRGSDDRRLSAQKNNNGAFRQVVLKQASHNYLGAEKNLADQIRYWLQEITSLFAQSRKDSAAITEIEQEIVIEKQ